LRQEEGEYEAQLLPDNNQRGSTTPRIAPGKAEGSVIPAVSSVKDRKIVQMAKPIVYRNRHSKYDARFAKRENRSAIFQVSFPKYLYNTASNRNANNSPEIRMRPEDYQNTVGNTNQTYGTVQILPRTDTTAIRKSFLKK
jgi:hypothetical protein